MDQKQKIEKIKEFRLIDDYYIGTRHILANLFGAREVLAYVTSIVKDGGKKRLFFSTLFLE